MSVGLPLGPIRVSGHTVVPDLGLSLPYKVHAYNLIMRYTMLIQTINIIADKDIQDLA